MGQQITLAAVLPGMSEDEWQDQVLQVAKLYGWRVAHCRPARTLHGWRTPVQGDAGLPDLILARRGRVLLVELKTDARDSVPTNDQRAWLAAAGLNGALWRPRDRAKMIETLRTA